VRAVRVTELELSNSHLDALVLEKDREIGNLERRLAAYEPVASGVPSDVSDVSDSNMSLNAFAEIPSSPFPHSLSQSTPQQATSTDAYHPKFDSEITDVAQPVCQRQ
jgi:hypothetical protein